MFDTSGNDVVRKKKLFIHVCLPMLFIGEEEEEKKSSSIQRQSSIENVILMNLIEQVYLFLDIFSRVHHGNSPHHSDVDCVLLEII